MMSLSVITEDIGTVFVMFSADYFIWHVQAAFENMWKCNILTFYADYTF